MAVVASSAVTSLLGVIRSEARLLRLVGNDVQFIKEEMESMNSFLAYLARSAPPGGEHDEQVRTWMNQVRLLAQDCSNCIDLYLYRGNQDVHRARGSLRRYLWWVYWYLYKLVAQHRAAVRLRQLKDRARDVGERRLRYGVVVPSSSTAADQPTAMARLMSAESSSAAAARDDEEDSDDDQDRCAQRALLSRTLEDYVKTKLFEWTDGFPTNAGETMSVAIVAPDRDLDALRLANTRVFGPDFEYYENRGYNCTILVDIPAVHPEFLPVGPKDVLFYILRQLKLDSQSQSSQKQAGTDQGDREDGADPWQVYLQKRRIYSEKNKVLYKVEGNIENMKIDDKLDKIKSGVKTRSRKSQKKDMKQKDPDVHVLLTQLLRSFVPASQQYQLMKNKDMPKLSASDNTIIAVAKKLKEHMEADEKDEGGDGGAGRGLEKDAVQEGQEGGGGGKGGVWRKVENKAVQEEGREGGEEHELGGGGEIVEEREGRGKILEEKHGGVGNHENKNDDKKEKNKKIASIHLDLLQYIHILRQVFPKISSSSISSSKQATETTLGEDQEDIFTKIVDQKMDKMEQEFKEQLQIKGLVDDILRQLNKKCPLFILKINETVDLPRWEDTRNALTLLRCSADVLIVTTAKDIQQAKEYCYPQDEPIDYSLAGLYYDTVLQITKQRKKEEDYDPQIFRNILERCKEDEFCMKIFTHALYVNPKRSNEELNKLLSNLQTSAKSSKIVIAKKMFKFSYTDMPKEYKSCFLYLAIFPPGHKIRRSTLIGRWVAEGLIPKEDWPSSVHWSNQCFDELINRRLADPADTSAAGKVKSCVVGDIVHGFIMEIARKQHMVETRLSHHLARHFSISNDLQLRVFDKIDGFFQRLSKSSRVETRLLKVLDLEGCKCFGGNNQQYLEDICSKMLLLKYLSLRGTDVTQLPSKINNLHELEVLDIRQTNVPMNSTDNVLLLKLKRLLAGNTDRSPRPTLGAEDVSTAVLIPHKIEKMENMEVLCKVKARSSEDLKHIGKLWQLKKLGVVVDDDSSYLKNLLRGISELNECLCSLSITIPRSEGAPSSQKLPTSLKHPPKLLKSLSISGTTQKGHLLPLFINDVDNNLLNKLTLSCTSLNQKNLDDLARLPDLQSMRLHHIAFTDIESSLVFKKEEFKKLKYLLVEGSSFTNISFMDGASCELEKMALSFTNIESVSGVDGLKKFKEVELIMSSSNKKNDTLLSSFNNGKQTMAKLTIVSTSLEQGDEEIPNMIPFNEGKFRKLKLLTLDCSATTNVVFSSGSAPQLEKIIWSSSTSLSGINNLPKLMELEFNGERVPEVVTEAIENHKNRPSLTHNKPEIQDQAKGNEQEDDGMYIDDDNDTARFPLFCWKK